MPALPDPGEGAGLITAEPLTPQELAVWEEGQAIDRASWPRLTDMLGRLVTLDAALIGGGLVVARGDVLPPAFGAVALSLFFLSLVVAMAGLWPRKAFLDLGDLAAIAAHRRERTHRAADALTVAGGLFLLAAAVAVAGSVVHAF